MLMTKALNRESRLRWLVSEMLVIVIGVLIALALDGYWNERHERMLEAEYLDRIRSDVTADIAYLEQVAISRLDTKLQALNAIAPIVRGQEPVPDDIESFLRNVSLGGLLGASSSYWVTDTTFEDLKSTGNLRLIRDPDLRWKVSRYYKLNMRMHERVRDRLTGYVTYVHGLMPAELRDDLTLDAMTAFGTDRAVERILSPEFEDLMNQELNYAYFMMELDRGSLARQLLQDMDNHLAQHPQDK